MQFLFLDCKILQMKLLKFFKTTGTINPPTQCNISEEMNLHNTFIIEKY